MAIFILKQSPLMPRGGCFNMKKIICDAHETSFAATVHLSGKAKSYRAPAGAAGRVG